MEGNGYADYSAKQDFLGVARVKRDVRQCDSLGVSSESVPSWNFLRWWSVGFWRHSGSRASLSRLVRPGVPRARCVSHATLVPLGQPEKAMGPESPIEPWLAPDNLAACSLRTDWLHRAKAMKTAGKENQTRCRKEAASRDHGTE